MKINIENLKKELPKFFLFLFAYFLISNLCIKYTSFEKSVAAIWLTSGFTIGFSLLFGRKYLIYGIISNFLMEIVLPIPLGIRLSFFAANLFEYLVAYNLIRYFIKDRDPLGSISDTTKIIISGVFVANLVSATISASGTVIFDKTTPSFLNIFISWFIANFSGYLVVLPMILAWYSPFKEKETYRGDFYLIIVLSIVINLFIFALELDNKINHALTFLPFVILFWSAVKLDQRLSTIITAITMLISVLFTVSGKGPFYSEELQRSLFLLSIYISVMTIISLLISVNNKNRLLVEANLSKTQEKYRILFESSKDAIMTLTPPNWLLQDINQAALDFFGAKSKDDLVNKNICEIVSPNQSESSENRCLIEIGKAVKEGNNFFEWKAKKLSGEEFPVTILLNLCHFDNEDFLQATIRDISLQKKAEKDLLKAKEDAENASKAKGEFLAIMSHEIRTPMNAFLGFINMAMETDLDPVQYEYINRASETGETLLQIINDILDFSKIESGKMQIEKNEFNLDDLMRKIMNVLSMKAEEKGLYLYVKKETELKENLLGGSMQISQVLLNLVGNAIKFTPKGEVGIIISQLSRSEDEIELLFEVTDTGIGITEDQQKKLFNAFSQADSSTTRKYGGTGLGLIISKKLVEIMGGNLNLNSQLGEGSTFSFALKFPISKNTRNEEKILADEKEKQRRNEVYKNRLNGINVLLVEDNELNRVIAGVVLNKAKLNLLIAKNGEEAIEIINREKVDCVLMDCYMPVMDGFEATKKLREIEKFKDLPIIALTANALEEDRQRVLEAGMNEYVTKPIREYELFELMNLCLFKEMA